MITITVASTDTHDHAANTLQGYDCAFTHASQSSAYGGLRKPCALLYEYTPTTTSIVAARARATTSHSTNHPRGRAITNAADTTNRAYTAAYFKRITRLRTRARLHAHIAPITHNNSAHIINRYMIYNANSYTHEHAR